jgi:hypothetical protein
MSRSPADTVQRWVRAPASARVQVLSVLGASAILLVALLCGVVVLQG